jgi:hypothetical protein
VDKSTLIPFLVLWGVAIAPLLYQVGRLPSCGLVAGYLFQMWMLHWIGALVHAFPWSELPDTELVAAGLEESTVAIIAFAVGAIVAGPALSRAMLGKSPVLTRIGELDSKIPRTYILMGIISYFVLAPTIGQFPGLNAVPAAGSQLVIVGCCLMCWNAWHRKGKTGLIKTLIPTLLIPMVTVVKQGFLGFGVIAVSIILLFTAQFFRPRWVLAVGLAVAAFLGLTTYVSYMRDRTEIRMAVWNEAPLSERIGTAWHTVSTLDWFDPTNEDQLGLIDERLNQNVLIGAAVGNLSTSGAYARGETIRDAVYAMVPRLIWPSKPVSAGSHGLVSSFTGMVFAEGTSVGVGPVLEFYGNFGTMGVLVGFFLMGMLVRALDIAAGTHLLASNWPALTSFFLVGISFLNVSGSLVEVSAGAMASLVVAKVAGRFLMRGTPAAAQIAEATAH